MTNCCLLGLHNVALLRLSMRNALIKIKLSTMYSFLHNFGFMKMILIGGFLAPQIVLKKDSCVDFTKVSFRFHNLVKCLMTLFLRKSYIF